MTRTVKVGNVLVGGGNVIPIQSMLNVRTADVEQCLEQINMLHSAGCDIIRVAVPDGESAAALRGIVDKSPIPVVADIHFDYRLAIAAVESGAAKIRINPGNIGGEDKVKLVADACKAAGIPIRVGVNSGSVDEDTARQYGRGAEGLFRSCIKSARLLERVGFDNLVLSVKSPSAPETVKANRLISACVDYPLHLGVTEAGGLYTATVKSAAAIGALLMEGIGDTIRVSVTGDPIHEIDAARTILRVSERDKNYVEIISCPTCGRTEVDICALSEKVAALTKNVRVPLRIAVMGCVVNGVGEGADSDLGIAGGKHRSVIFKGGKVLRTVDNEQLEQELMREVTALIEAKEGV